MRTFSYKKTLSAVAALSLSVISFSALANIVVNVPNQACTNTNKYAACNYKASITLPPNDNKVQVSCPSFTGKVLTSGMVAFTQPPLPPVNKGFTFDSSTGRYLLNLEPALQSKLPPQTLNATLQVVCKYSTGKQPGLFGLSE